MHSRMRCATAGSVIAAITRIEWPHSHRRASTPNSEHLDGKQLRFTDSQRIRLARRAKALGSKGLHDLTPIVTPETLLRWYRKLIARSA